MNADERRLKNTLFALAGVYPRPKLTGPAGWQAGLPALLQIVVKPSRSA